MDRDREMAEFRPIQLVAEVDRVTGLLVDYRKHCDHYRRKLHYLHDLIGRIGERLGEPEPEEPRWRIDL